MIQSIIVLVKRWKIKSSSGVNNNEKGSPFLSRAVIFRTKYQMSVCLVVLQKYNKVKEYVQTGTISVVVITGGPGFGKTTVAKAVAHELAKPENRKTVLFCSLLSKKSFGEVVTEMILSCGKIYTQVPENPDQWLKDWSKQVQAQVTLVLDNADGVLESEDRNSFLSTLGAIRKLSKQNVTFVITSRKTLQDPDLPSKDVLD